LGLAPAHVELVPRLRETLADFVCEGAIAIVDEETVGMIAGQRFPELLQRPCPGGMGCNPQRGVVVDSPGPSGNRNWRKILVVERGIRHFNRIGPRPGLGNQALFNDV